MNEIISLGEYNGISINARPTDQFINATAMCQANGKRWNDFIRLKSTKEFLEELRSAGFPADQIIQVTDGPNELRGTWVSEDVAIALAQWLSPKFHVWTVQQVKRILHGQQVAHPEHAEAKFYSVMGKCYEQLTHTVSVVGGQVAFLTSEVAKQGEQIEEMNGKVDSCLDIVKSLSPARKDPTKETVRAHENAVFQRGGVCPCCNTIRVLDEDGKRINEAEIDHIDGKHLPHIDKTWLVCGKCNDRLKNRTERAKAKIHFEAYCLFRESLASQLKQITPLDLMRTPFLRLDAK